MKDLIARGGGGRTHHQQLRRPRPHPKGLPNLLHWTHWIPSE